MKHLYKYTLLKQDGSKYEFPVVQRKKTLAQLYKILKCHTVEQIHPAYYSGHGHCFMWGDEEARFNENNHRNPHFKVLKGDTSIGEPAEFDVVGNVLKEETIEVKGEYQFSKKTADALGGKETR
jgi:hypothetical protein